MLDIVKRNATIDGKLYALPYLWGTDGLVVNVPGTRPLAVTFTDLCRPDLKDKTSIRLRRPILMAFAFAHGQGSIRPVWKSQGLRRAHGPRRPTKLIACKGNFKFFFDNKDQLLNGFRSGEIWAAAMWDTGGWTLNRESPGIQYIVPQVSGALGWIDTFALPARGRNDSDAAYAWINFTMRPGECRTRVIKSVGNFSAAKGTAPFVDPRLQGAVRGRRFPTTQLQEHPLVSRHTAGDSRRSTGVCWIGSRPPN